MGRLWVSLEGAPAWRKCVQGDSKYLNFRKGTVFIYPDFEDKSARRHKNDSKNCPVNPKMVIVIPSYTRSAFTNNSTVSEILHRNHEIEKGMKRLWPQMQKFLDEKY